MLVEAENLAHAKTGDRVVISFDTAPLLKATFLICYVGYIAND